MKRRSWILMLVCALLLTGACQKKNTPEAATENFAKAFYTADFSHMYQYTTKKSDIVVQQLQNGMKSNSARMEEMQKTKVEFVETKVVEQTDSTATCSCAVNVNGEQRNDKWDLQKEKGEWKVTLVLP